MPDESESRSIVTGKSDVFGVPTSNIVNNVLDIPSHYPYNPERLRLFVDGTRQFPEYGSVSQYNHAGPHHELLPAQGETVTLETSERPRYSVGFEQIYSAAFGLSRSLESGDRIRIGPFDDNDGWFMEQRGSDHAKNEVDLKIRAGGSDTKGAPNQTLILDAQKFTRFELRTAWYRVTRQLWRESLARGGIQQTKTVGRTSGDDGPEIGNLPIRFEVTRDSASSSLTFQAGSCALLTQGDKTAIRRVKTHEVSLTTDGNADGATWFPQYAMRIDPDRSIVDTQISSVVVTSYEGNNDVRVLLASHDPSNVLKSGPSELADSDFSVAESHMAQNSVLEETDTSTVTQAADSTGSTTTSTTDPGGFQVGYGSLHSAGTGSSSGKAADATTKKRGIYGGDTVVMWVRADDASVNLQVNITTEQDW